MIFCAEFAIVEVNLKNSSNERQSLATVFYLSIFLSLSRFDFSLVRADKRFGGKSAIS